MAAAYLASRVSPSQFETPTEGYRICRSVPICRTGSQDYVGFELIRHESYNPAWSLDPNGVYPVFRPLNEITSRATVASFEGKSITDEHPAEHIAPGSLISCKTERQLSCGHLQNVRVGPPMSNGDVPLLADLHIKDDVLIDKVDAGIRDVSCGYTYELKRTNGGTLIQTQVRGNHVAVLPRGRGGAGISIADAAAAVPRPEIRFWDGVPWHVGQERYQRALEADMSAPELSPNHFFSGVSYDLGKARYEEYLRQRATSVRR